VRLQKHTKLLKAAEFDRVFEKPVRSSDRYFTVLARSNEMGHSRLGLVISKRKVRLSVGRNRLKRIIRENFRLTSENCCVDYVVLAAHLGASASNNELFKSLERHWKNIKKKCEKF
jgi:ribonuclease P protein component